MDEAALPTVRITMALCAAYRMRGEQRENKKQREARFLCDEVRQASSWVRKKAWYLSWSTRRSESLPNVLAKRLVILPVPWHRRHGERCAREPPFS